MFLTLGALHPLHVPLQACDSAFQGLGLLPDLGQTWALWGARDGLFPRRSNELQSLCHGHVCGDTELLLPLRPILLGISLLSLGMLGTVGPDIEYLLHGLGDHAMLPILSALGR